MGDAPNMSSFTDDEVAAWRVMPKMEKPKGKPTPEMQAKMKVDKATRNDFLAGVMARLSYAEKQKKQCERELDAAAAEGAAAEEVVNEYLNPPSGTRDFYPADKRIQNWLFGEFRQVAKEFGFEEYDAPVLENTALYERKAGEEITQQMYNFVDKEGHNVTLRPEMTPSLARLVLQRQNAQTGAIQELMPLKWFTIAQCWRFETCQRGRKREHYQWNMDIVGVKGIRAELELLCAVSTFFRKLGIGPEIVGIKINSRRLLSSLLMSAGVEKDSFSPACVIIDKLDKIGGDEVKCQLLAIGVSAKAADSVLTVLQSADGKDDTLEQFSQRCSEYKSDKNFSDALDEMTELFNLAEQYKFVDYLQFDASVVRGLAYYTGVVFEAFVRPSSGMISRAICGGGRYDGLMTTYLSPVEVPCVGFGFGDCVIMDLLQDLKLVKVPERSVEFVVLARTDALYMDATRITAALRAAGKTVDLSLTVFKKVKQAFDYADRIGGRKVVFVAEDELEQGSVKVKDMYNKDANDEAIQVVVPIDDLANIDSYFGESEPVSVMEQAGKARGSGMGLKWMDVDESWMQAPSVSAPANTAAPAAKKDDDDDDCDLFGDDDEEEEETKPKETPQEMAARKKAEAQAKKKKAAPVGKSTIVFDVKPACFDGDDDDEDSGGTIDLADLVAFVKGIKMEGLVWGEKHQFADIGYGIKKLQVQCTVVDDLVGVDDLREMMEANEDLVQSCDVVAFNKV